MAWIGKLVGGALGYAAGRLPGALLGLLLGHQFDRGMASRGGASSGPDRGRIFFETTFLVLGHLAKTDGRVSEAEIDSARAVMRRMRLDERRTRLAMDLFNQGKDPAFPVDQRVAALRDACAAYPELLQTFLEIQLDLALAKGSVSPVERELLGRIADGIGVGRLGLARLEALLRARRAWGNGQRAATPDLAIDRSYAVLGVAPSASDQEVRTAYRRLMNQHHPDKQAARGLPEAMLEMAKERTAEIRAAWEAIKAHRGLK